MVMAKRILILGALSLFLAFLGNPCLGAEGSIVDGYLSTTAPTDANTSGATKTPVFKLTDKRGGLVGNFWFDAIGGITTYAGVSVYYLPANENTTIAWNNAERIPIMLNENVVSGETSVPKEFSAPATLYGRFEYEIQQTIAAQDNVTASLSGHAFLVDATKMIDTAPVRTGPMVPYPINNNSGVSSLLVPNGTRRVVISLRGDDIVWTPDGSSPDDNNAYTLSQGDYLTLDSNEQADNFRFRVASGGTGTTVYATPYTK